MTALTVIRILHSDAELPEFVARETRSVSDNGNCARPMSDKRRVLGRWGQTITGREIAADIAAVARRHRWQKRRAVLAEMALGAVGAVLLVATAAMLVTP